MPDSLCLVQQELCLLRRSEGRSYVSKGHNRADRHGMFFLINGFLYFVLQRREVVIPLFVEPSTLTDERLVNLVRAATVRMPPIWQLADSDGFGNQINQLASGLWCAHQA